jgi:SecD/SecF fusion protein
MLLYMKALFLSLMIGVICSCSSTEDQLAKNGGHTFLLIVQERVDDSGTKIPTTNEHVDQAIRAIEGRLEDMGISTMSVSREGDAGIRLKLPGVSSEEAQRISTMLEKSSLLGLHEVCPRNDETNAEGITLAQRVQNGDEIAPGFRAYTLKGKDADGNDYIRPILINRRVALGGECIAMATHSPSQPDAVDITLNGRGAEKMIDFTKNMRPGLDRIAIVLDGEVISAPVIMDTPLGKQFSISGLDKPGEAQLIAISLMHPFEHPLKVQEIRSIPPAVK